MPARAPKNSSPSPKADGSYDVAAGATVFASSSYTSGACASNACRPLNAVDGTDAYWASSPYTCGSSAHNESLTIDWASKYGIKLISEVRFRYGPGGSGDPTLILYSQTALNVPNPTAYTFVDNEDWSVYLFTQNITASSIVLVLSNIASPNNSDVCYTTIAEVQAWVGMAPDYNETATASGAGSSSSTSKLSGGAVAGIVIAVLAVVAAAVAAVLYATRGGRRGLLAGSLFGGGAASATKERKFAQLHDDPSTDADAARSATALAPLPPRSTAAAANDTDADDFLVATRPPAGSG
ncbi:hypothetical protein HK405_001992, partial [Cladochytrium tenue]